MKKILFFGLLLIVAIGTTVHFSGCSDASASKLDIVNDVEPFDVHNIEWRTNFNASLKHLTPVQRKMRIDSAAPLLTSQLIASVRRRGFTCEITSLTYMYGTGSADSVSSGDSLYHDGVFEDQLYAVLKGSCFVKPLKVFILCMNGTFKLEGDDQETIGDYPLSFTIEKPHGINSYTDYLTSVWIAEKFERTLYEGHGKNRKIITPARARELKDSLHLIPVTVLVYPGDKFDLGIMKYTRARN